MRRLIIPWVALALLAVSCGGSSTADSTTTTTTSSTTTTLATTTSERPTTSTRATTTTEAEETTVTTHPPGFASPLNGLASENEIHLDRRAIGVKIDNHSNARPQSGVMDADMVVEIRVEAGLTRFIAFFHDNDSDYVGPIRSVRPTDSTIARAMGVPLVISGGQPWVQALTASRGVGLIGPGAADLFRIPGRPGPHDLYGDTDDMRDGADAQGYADEPPVAPYEIGTWEYPEAVAESVTLDWSDAVTVEWDYADGVYSRTHNGVPHENVDRDGERSPMQADVLVVLTGEFYTAFPPADGQAIPATDTAGSGRAFVFARGRVWEGTWERAQYEDPFRLYSLDGTEAVVPAGFAWVSVFPEHRSIQF